jgi:hypothetical protein
MHGAVDELVSTEFWTDKVTAEQEIRRYIRRQYLYTVDI